MIKPLSIYPIRADESFTVVSETAKSALITPQMTKKKTREKICIYVTLFSLNIFPNDALTSVVNSDEILLSVVDCDTNDVFI